MRVSKVRTSVVLLRLLETSRERFELNLQYMYIGLSRHTPFPKLFQPAKLPQFETRGGKEKENNVYFSYCILNCLYIYMIER